jgi:hypothetical protein
MPGIAEGDRGLAGGPGHIEDHPASRGGLPVAKRLGELHEEGGTARELERAKEGIALQHREPEQHRRADDRRAGKEAAEPAPGGGVQEVLDLLHRHLDPVADPPKFSHSGYDSW